MINELIRLKLNYFDHRHSVVVINYSRLLLLLKLIVMNILRYVLPLLCFFNLFFIQGNSLSKPTAIIPDISYTTGTAVIISANWTSPTPTSFPVSYQTTMSTTSLNGALGVMGVAYYMKGNQWGWLISIVSLSQTSLTLYLNVKNSNNPIFYLQICYFVTSNTLLDVNQKAHSFSGSYAIANSSMNGSNCFVDCRSYQGSVSYVPKTGGRVVSMLSGFTVNNNVPNGNSQNYFGISVQVTQPSNTALSTSFNINITVYGGAQINYVTYFYIAFEINTINIINYRLETDGFNVMGCYYSAATCAIAKPYSNTGFTTSKTGVNSYSQSNFLVGISRMIMTWSNDYSLTGDFRITSVFQNSDSSIGAPFTFAGNTNLQFNAAYSYFTLQTFYCPTSGTIDIYYVYNTNMCDSACTLTQYANASNFCLPCGTYCWTCVSSPTFCTSCYSSQNRVNSSNLCVCDVAGGFYDDGSVKCPACHYSCKTCSGGSLAECLTCSSSNDRNLFGNTCVCNQGYYENNGSSCQPCHYTCSSATCSDSNNVDCTTCNLTKSRVQLANFTCGCLDGFYDNSTNSEQCASCLSSCMTCWGSNTFCTSCDPNDFRFLTNISKCSCQSGYYDNGVATCSKCYPTCMTCIGGLASNCITCDISLQRSLVGNTCTCGLRYYDSSNTCLSCSYTCLTCTSFTLTTCTACNSVAFRTINTTLSSCPCQNGYYDAGIEICLPCSATCLTCFGTANNCTSCHANPGRYFSGAGYSCLCSSGYIDTSFNGLCTSCHYSCSTCSGTYSSCVVCASNRVLSGSACNCPSGTYDDGVNAICQPCSSTCLSCNGLSTSCTSCNSAYFRVLNPSPVGSCSCSISYFDAGILMCQQCSSKCLTCWGSSTNCTSCDNSTNHRFISAINTCDCAAGYLDLGPTVCVACLYPCSACSILPNNCTSCFSDRNLSSGACVCKAGYFQNSSSACQLCSFSCATCSSSTSCLTCPSGTNRVQMGSTCPCISGYLQTNTAFCLPCSYTCASCTTFASVCSACPINSFRVLNGSSACPCIDGYYDNGGSSACLLCSKTCLTCTYYSQCLSCNATLNRVWDSLNLVCSCISGYYDNGSATCSLCHYSCLTCSGPLSTNCYTCQTNRILTFPSSCPCTAGLYDSLGVCSPCSISCKTCSISASNCTSCLTGSILVNYQCICSTGYYFNGNQCYQCDPICLSCSVISSSCTACNPAQGTVLSGASCTCPSTTYFNSSVSICRNCNFQCLTCSGGTSTSCLSCSITNNRSFNNLASSCDCLSGYYDDGTAMCKICTFPCLTCKGASILNCTSCNAGYTLIGSFCSSTLTCPVYIYQGLCVSSCPSTAYPSGIACNTCINNCLTCTSATYCLTCHANYFIYNNSCLLACPTNTYPNIISNIQICSYCPSACSECTTYLNQLICLSCQTGYYLLNYTCTTVCPNATYAVQGLNCVPCLYPCLNCNSLSSNTCTACVSGFYLFNSMCLANCPSGYVSTNSICTACPSNCSQCNNNSCAACLQGYYLTKLGQCLPNGYYYERAGKVAKCHVNCMSCTNSSFSSCIACGKYRGDSAQMAISGYCDCWKSSVDLGNGTCDAESYKMLQSFTDVLVTTTTSVNYFSALSGIISTNFMAAGMNIYYQQTYSNFYFINSSAVLQTDAVLDRYGDTSISKFTKAVAGDNGGRLNYGRRLTDYETHFQDDQSLFMRGSSFQYLVDYAKIIVIITFCLWGLLLIMYCIVPRLDKRSNAFIISNKILSFINESAIILLLFFTFNEITIYSFASFKIIAFKYSNQINYFKLGFSILVFAYYIIYLIRLFVGSLITFKPGSNKYKIIYAFFQASKLSRKLCRMYLPLLLFRSLLLSIFIVFFSYSPQIQIISSVIVILLWDVYSFIACPYKFYVRVFIRFHELLFTFQILLLTISTSYPENSRLNVAIALQALNFMQVFIFIGLGISVLLDKIHNVKCLKRQENAVASFENHQAKNEKTPNKEIVQNTIDALDEKLKQDQLENNIVSNNGKDKGMNKINNESLKQMNYQEFDMPAQRDVGELKEIQPDITKKKYRVKRDKKY